jgi:hypothetical protein
MTIGLNVNFLYIAIFHLRVEHNLDSTMSAGKKSTAISPARKLER